MKLRSKRLLSVFLSILMVFTALNVTTFAESNKKKLKNDKIISENLKTFSSDPIYVDGTLGEDTTNDGSETSPVKTLEKAIELAENGGLIVIQGK